jgi:hypothetical protein
MVLFDRLKTLQEMQEKEPRKRGEDEKGAKNRIKITQRVSGRSGMNLHRRNDP